MSDHHDTLKTVTCHDLDASLDPYIVARAHRDASGVIDDFEYVDVNERACHYFQRSREEVLASTMRELLPRDFATQLVSWLGTVIETGTPAERFDAAFYNTGTHEMGRFDVRAVSDGDLVTYTFRDLRETHELLERYRQLLEYSSDFVVRTDRDGLIQWMSNSVTDILGYRTQDLVGTSFVDLLHMDDVVERLSILERMVDQEMVRFRVNLRGVDERFHTFSARAQRVTDSQGVVQGVIAGLHLIDNEVQAEATARHAEERYRLMANYGTDVISLERHGTVEWVSPYLEQLLNLSSADVVGRALSELVHPDDRTSLQSISRADGRRETQSLVLRMRMADSSYRWVTLRSREFVEDETGERLRVTSWRDAQSDVASQRALMTSENRFRLLAENSTDVVIECDVEGLIHWVSPSAQATLGWRVEGVVGTQFEDLVVGDDKHRVHELHSAMATHQPSPAVEVRFLTSTGHVRWMSMRMRQVRGLNGEKSVIIVALHDIDEEVNLRNAAWEMESRFHMLADNMTDVVYSVNLEGELTWISSSVIEQLGWQVADMIGHSVLDLILPEDRARVVAWRELLHFGEHLDDLMIRVRQGSGAFVWMKARAQATRDAHGHLSGVVVALRNCDAEVATRRALHTISAGSRVLIRGSDSMRMLQQMCQVAVDEGGYMFAWYGRKVNDERKSVEVFAHSLGQESYLEDISVTWGLDDLGQGLTGRAIRLGETCTATNIDTDDAFRPWRESALRHGFHSVAAIPIVVNGEIDGSWQVYAHELRAFTPQVLEVLEDMALEIGYGLSRSK